MSVASASVAVPTVMQAPISTVGLAEKVSIRNLDFYYGTSKALKGISLPLYQNKVTAFIGPSGCGKSTLLRVLNRMYDLYPNQRAEGEVLFDGEDILSPKQDLNLLRARIGMVFQKPTPFPMSIYENIAFGVLVGIELIHPVQYAQQRRFSAARRSDEGGDLVLVERQRNAFQRLRLAVEKLQPADRHLVAQAGGIDRRMRGRGSRHRGGDVHDAFLVPVRARAVMLSASTEMVMISAPVQASFCQSS